MDFKLSKLTGDLDFGGDNSLGLQLHTDFGDEAIQRMQQALTLNLGEWFANVNAGLPYIRNKEEETNQNLQYFFGNKINRLGEYISATIDEYIKSFSFVTSLLSSSYELDTKSRNFTYTGKIKLDNGSVISFPYNTFIEL